MNIDIDKFYENLSSARLDVYDNFFSLQKDKDKLTFIYLALQDLTSSFYPLFQILEVTLRNKIHTALEKEYGTPYWYIDLYLNDVTEGHFITAKRKSKQKTSNHFICEVPFGAWVNLLFPINRGSLSELELAKYQEDEQKKLVRIEQFWGRELDTIFSGRNSDSIKTIFESLKDINNLRNRFSHFEPLWKPNKRAAANIKPGEEFNEICKTLQKKHQKILSVLSLCCPETSKYLAKNTNSIFDEKIKFYKDEWLIIRD